MTSAVVTFTSKSVETILAEGGSAAWSLSRNNARNCEYLVCTRNGHSDWVEGQEPHASAFLVGRVSDVVPAGHSNPDRWLIKISEYARVMRPNTWKRWRNPVHYTRLEELGIDPTQLEFEPMPVTPVQHPEPRVDPRASTSAAPVSVLALKKALASTLGVDVGSIEITIRA